MLICFRSKKKLNINSYAGIWQLPGFQVLIFRLLSCISLGGLQVSITEGDHLQFAFISLDHLYLCLESGIGWDVNRA